MAKADSDTINPHYSGGDRVQPALHDRYNMKWFKKRNEQKRKQLFNRGYDYAAGSLLRGEETPISLESRWWHNVDNNEFDSGIMAATAKLIDLGIIEDDTI